MEKLLGVLFTLGMVGICLAVAVMGVWFIMELFVIPWVKALF